MSNFNVPCDTQSASAPSPRRRRCECYSCRLAAGMGADANIPPEWTPRALCADELNTRLLQIIPQSQDAETRVDEILGLALSAFDAREITEAQFRELSAKCLDTLTYLAR